MIDKIFGALELFAPGLDMEEAWGKKEDRVFLVALVAGIVVCTLVSNKLQPELAAPKIEATQESGDYDELED